MWTRTRLTAALGIALPILQGPFGGGNSTPALAAAVSNAGALDAIGAVGLAPDEIEDAVRGVRALTGKPFAINLWVPIVGQDDAVVTDEAFARAVARTRPQRLALGLPAEDVARPAEPSYASQLDALLRAAPPVFSFVMGVPDPAVCREIRRRGAHSVGTATTVDEAVALADAGVDVVVASGSDAGGHRGSFLRAVERSLIGTMSLVPQVVDAVGVPVVAAGGIADGRGIAAALALGAEGVQVGSAFLATEESGAPPSHKALLGTPAARATRLTRAFTGRHARGIENELMDALEAHPEDVLPYPAQGAATRDVRRAAAASGRADMQALWAGQSAALARRIDAAALVRALVEETDAALRSPRMRAQT